MSHQAYSNDTIQEALCEIRFKPSPSTEWSSKHPAELLKRLGIDKFPGMEPIDEFSLEFVVDGSGAPKQRIIQGPTKLRFSSEDNSLYVQVSPIVYSLSAVGRYPGWQQMQAHIIENWEKIRPVLSPIQIERIGLRYINKVPLDDDSAPFSGWLRQSRYIPAAIEEALPGSKFRLEVRLSDTNAMAVTVADRKDEDGKHYLFFDIDRWTKITGLPDLDDLAKITQDLHEHIWDIFEEAKTENYEKYLNQERGLEQ